MKLSKLLLNIKENKKDIEYLFRASTGKHFEKNILEYLTEDGTFISISQYKFVNHKNFRSCKKRVTQMTNKTELNVFFKNDLFSDLAPSGRNIIIYQPFGSQMYPDFLIMNNEHILPIEIKFSTRGGGKPTWNSGLPRSGGLYLFGSYMRKEITFFMGEDMISDKTREQLISLFNYAEIVLKKKIDSLEPDFSEFDVYMRRMYNQKNDILKNKKRIIWEEKALNKIIDLNF